MTGMSTRIPLKTVAAAVGLSPYTIYDWVRFGKFKLKTVNGRRVWYESDIERLRAFIADGAAPIRTGRPRSKKPRRFASPTLAQVYDLVSKESIPELADRSGYTRDLLYHIQYGRDSSFTKIENILQALGYKLKIMKIEED